jgi:hypothetical protein
MRTKLKNTAEVFHFWANKVQERGECSSVSFVEGVLYSYATAIGEFVTNAAGEEAVILNHTPYSMTTSGHQADMRRAIPSGVKLLRRYGVPRGASRLSAVNIGGMLDRDAVRFTEQLAAQALAKAEKARTRRGQYEAEAAQYIQSLVDIAEFFGVKYDAPANLDALKKAEQARMAQQAAELKVAQAKRAAEQAERLEQWRVGAYVGYGFEVTALRVQGDLVQTSRGAEIPVDHARRFWPVIKAWHESGERVSVSERHIRLGHYTVQGFADDVLTVGCHQIPYSEIERIAAQLGL